MSRCKGCGLEFAAGDSHFDAHRVGEHDYTYSEGLKLDPPREDGRRCLHVYEMEEQGWMQDRWGRWRVPGKQVREILLERVTL